MDAVTRLKTLDEQLALEGESAQLLVEYARIWRALKNTQNAYHSAKRAVELAPDHATNWSILGLALMDLQRWSDAEQAFAKTLSIDSAYPGAGDNLAEVLHQQTWQVQRAAEIGNWAEVDANGPRLLELHHRRMQVEGKGIVAPFSALGFQLNSTQQRDAAIAQAADFLRHLDRTGCAPRVASSQRTGNQATGARVKVGFLSADFRNNAAGHLLHQLFKEHDKTRYEIFGLSYGPEDGSMFRRFIRDGVDHFIDLSDLSDSDASAVIRAQELDLIIDLMGFAGNHRAGILASRPAPVQASWLGYCVTTGAPWIDWFIADRITVPQIQESAFTEQVALLPDSYQIYSGQHFERGSASRAEHGLPESAIVYCCFNMPEKVDTPIWSMWMEILTGVPDGVLWLLCGSRDHHNFYRERASAAGIDSGRIIAADVLPKDAHLARLELADLVLDTTLCNAHTTASDALWAGVPVLTLPGELFAQRVAASVCKAAGQSGLIAENPADYVRTAIALGHDRLRLADHKQQLAQARPSAALFDTARFARNLELVIDNITAYVGAESRSQANAGHLPLIIVMGSWRSGTSALAGALSCLGVHFGPHFAQLKHETQFPNTFEATDLFPMLWSVLREPDMEQIAPISKIKGPLLEWLHHHQELAQSAGKPCFGLKHPAASLIAEEISKCWPNTFRVGTIRPVEDSYNSMRRIGWRWPEQAAKRGLDRQQQATLAQCDGPLFEFPGFLQQRKNTIVQLCDYLDLSPTQSQLQAAIDSMRC